MTPVILLVDDDPDDIRLYSLWLGALGLIRTAKDGHDAWISMRTMKPDLMLIDLLMPVLDGHQLLRMIQADVKLRDVPTILISGAIAGLGEDKDVVALRESVDVFLFKPITREQAVEAAKTLLSGR